MNSSALLCHRLFLALYPYSPAVVLALVAIDLSPNASYEGTAGRWHARSGAE
jgi:hypothetical protein